MLIKNVTVIDLESPWNETRVDISILDGEISEIKKSGMRSQKSEVDGLSCDGSLNISPGWIDMQTHLSDPGHEQKETLAQLAQAALFGGFTQILCYPNTDPVVDKSSMIHSLRARSASLPVEMLFCGAISEAATGGDLAELYDMHIAGAKAFCNGKERIDAGLLMRALQYVQPFDGLIISNASDPYLSQGGQMNEGFQSAYLGMKGIPEIAESTMIAQFLEVLDYASGNLHLQTISSPRAISLIQKAKSKLKGLSAGINISHLVLSDEDVSSFDSNYKLFPPLRSASQRKSLRQALKKGWVDVITSGHQAQGLEEKQHEFAKAEAGILGLQSLFSLAYEHLVLTEIIDLSGLIKLLTHNPRAILGLEKLTVEVGAKADLTLFQTEKEWTFSEVHCFSPARNSPFLGNQMKAKAFGTVLDGEFHKAD